MSEQLLLFEMPPPSPPPPPTQLPKLLVPRCSLFLALFPDLDAARHIADLGNALRQKHRMHGIVRPITHLHVSLRALGGTTEVPKIAVGTVVDHICKAVTAVTPPFEISFSRVLSFRRQPGNRPLVLVGDSDASHEVRRLHGLLHAELAKYTKSTRLTPKFEPHITLLYDRQELAAESIEPICWTVNEIVLVCSEVGATKYHRVASWAFSN